VASRGVIKSQPPDIGFHEFSPKQKGGNHGINQKRKEREMDKLTNKMVRCSGKYDFYTERTCPTRDRCLRYQSFVRLDKENGIEHYRGVPVMMAMVGCKVFIEMEAE
jgi:hypothetical protein